MKKKLAIVWAAVLLSGFACLYFNLHPIRWLFRPPELLRGVGIDHDLRIKIEEYDYWKDLLSYVSGFEAFAAQVNPDDWIALRVGIRAGLLWKKSPKRTICIFG